jgi:nucleoside-diphosphate-sugar epimerase
MVVPPSDAGKRVSGLRGSTVMVTGGCGFIGSHLVRRLLADGVHRVVVVDSLRYGDAANLGGDLERDRVELVRFTLGTDPVDELASHMRGVGYLFHLAAEKHNQSKDDPEAVLRANVNGTCALFELAARSGVGRTVFSSSLYSYGRTTGAPMTETEPLLPLTIYGISKLCGERLLAHFTRSTFMQGSVLRYFFVYGPRQFAGMGYKSVVLRNFERLLAGQPPVIFGDGRQRLDYVFVDDVVEATLRCMESPTAGHTCNVGSGIAVSITELTAAMLAVAGSRLVPVHAEPDETAGSCRVANVAHMQSVLGWAPRVSLEEGLRRTLVWLKEEAAR